MIPWYLKIFSFVYEYGRFFSAAVLIIFFAAMFLICYRKMRRTFLLMPLIFILISALDIAILWCGWHYRMELREKFARVETRRGYPGYSRKAAFTDEHGRSYNISLMPPEVSREYAKHNYSPRFRDLKARMIGALLLFILIIFFQIAVSPTVFAVKQKKQTSSEN